MEDRNKDLPLIVSEILIEMHEMKGDMHEMKEDMREMKEDMREVKTAIQQMASLMLKQQQSTNDQFRLLLEENRKNTEYMVSAFRNEAQETRQRLDNHEGRITKLENE